jgi:endonuclease/exonuclease/phosphatase (EEP) superfamily protein YafD
MFRALLTASAFLALLSCLVPIYVRALPLMNLPALVVAVAAPYTPLVALAGLTLLALCRRRLLSLVAVAVLVATLAIQLPWYYFGHPADVGAHTDIRVLSSNLRKGQADAAFFVGLAGESADVITVSELTPDEAERFSQAGIDHEFPYSMIFPAPDAGGIGVWSRFPLDATTPLQLPDVNGVAARLQIPGVRFDPVVASGHIISPVASDQDAFIQWRSGIDSTKAVLNGFAEIAGPAAVIVGGDFNSTPDMRQFRDLLTNGYRDAVEQTGAGFAPTFPSNRRRVPPLLTIDHVLTRNAAASWIRTIKMPGSDHRSLLAPVEVPLDPTAS